MLRLGTCSWKYPSWEGLVYSSREPADYLAEYARHFDSVEVDQWFWSLGAEGRVALPRPETVASYAAAVGEDFRFVVKCPDALSLPRHRPRRGVAGAPNPRFLDPELFLRFLDALAPLVPRIGLFLFQFEYLNRDKMPSRSIFEEGLGAFLGKLPADLPYAVEIRNPRWLDRAWFGFLDSTRAAPCLIQGYWMDDVAETLRKALAAGEGEGPGALRRLLGPRACLRLHGEDREGMDEKSGEDWSRILRPKDEELTRLVGLAKAVLADGTELWIDVNNHYEGSAPITAAKIRGMLGLPAAGAPKPGTSTPGASRPGTPTPGAPPPGGA